MTKKKNGRSLKLVGKLTRLVKARVNEEEYTLICNFAGVKESEFLGLLINQLDTPIS